MKKTDEYYYQWKQNNNRDIKGVILLLLPFIDDKDNSYLLKTLTDLNQLLYSEITDKISNNIVNEIINKPRDTIINKYFKFGNMGIGLLNMNNKNLLSLYDENTQEKLIYKIMYHNLLSLLYTLEIMNGKYYINWINIVPINISNYNTSNLYIKTLEYINVNNNRLTYSNITKNSNLLYYSGLWIGDIYNILRIKFYEEIKNIKWLIFPYEISETNKIYLINGLNKMINLEYILNNNNLLPNYVDIFYNEMKSIIFNLENMNSILGNFKVDIEIVKYFLIYLLNDIIDSLSIDFDNILDKFILSDDNNDPLDNDFIEHDINKFNKINLNDIIYSLNKLLENKNENNLKYIWIFLKNQLNLLINSAFGKYLIIKDNNVYTISSNYKFNLLNNTLNNNLDNIDINLKNIYNICKSLAHQNVNNWQLIDKNYISLNRTSRLDYFSKILNIEPHTN